MAFTIREAVTEAIEYFESPPPNESNTCEWVILPLLWSAGYARRDIHSRIQDHNKQFPDYTLLANDAEYRWFVEVKAWNVELAHEHAIQALDYANHNGVRWVGLTNGRVWRLYDNSVQGLVGQKHVIEVSLNDRRQLEDFLAAIGKESVISGGLERLAARQHELRKQQAEEERRARQAAERRERLAILLPLQLTDENSDLIDWMCEVLRTEEGLQDLSPAEVAAYFRAIPAVAGFEARENAESSREPERCVAESGPVGGETREVLVVAAYFAIQEYLAHSVYMCQPRRTFRETSHMAFYTRGRIDRHVPRILDRVESVVLTEEAIRARTDLPEKTRDRLLTLVESLKTAGQIHNRIGFEAKVLFLSAPNSPDTIRLEAEVENDLVTASGKPWPFAVGQRYASLDRLKKSPATTTELLGESR